MPNYVKLDVLAFQMELIASALLTVNARVDVAVVAASSTNSIAD